MKTFKTAKGTELPLIQLKGKDYLQVQDRIIWFREEHPLWGIETDLISVSEKASLARAQIKDETGRIIATAHKTETAAGFPDHTEKCETGAIGRALALIGYGTQFAQELSEGERIVDGPREAKILPISNPGDPGSYVMPFGKFKGMTLAQMGAHDADNYGKWLKENHKPGSDDSAIKAIEAFVKSREVKR